jgi:hypothetical protein
MAGNRAGHLAHRGGTVKQLVIGAVILTFISISASAWAQGNGQPSIVLAALAAAARPDTTVVAANSLTPAAFATPEALALVAPDDDEAQAPAAPVAPAPATPPPPTPAEVAAKQDSASMAFFRAIELSGFGDAYYTYNGNRPAKPCTTAGNVAVFNCLYNFNVAHNSISLSMAEFSLNKTPASDSRVGFRVDFDFGPTQTIVQSVVPNTMGTANTNSASAFQNIGQAYVSYLAPAGKGLQFDAGKFVTLFGQEVIKTKDDWNYSRSLLFAWAIPYFHEGVRATYNFSDKVSLAGYLVNGWNTAGDNNTGKSGAVALTLKPNGMWTIVENYMAGPEQNNDNKDIRQLTDTIVTFAPNAKVSLVANYDYGQDKVAGARQKWQGIAGYLHYQPNAVFSLTPRGEYFNDRDGFQTGVAQKLKEGTLTAEFKSKEGFIMRLEYRGDFSNTPYFNKKSSTAKYQNTVTAGVIYAFTTKAQ